VTFTTLRRYIMITFLGLREPLRLLVSFKNENEIKKNYIVEVSQIKRTVFLVICFKQKK